MNDIDVIYVAGVGRSGSTVLDRVLGTLDGVVSFNEIYRFFLEGHVENALCACGERFSTCDFWTKVFARTVGDETQARHLMDLQRRIDHSRHFLRLLRRRHSGKFATEVAEYRAWLGQLYFTLAELAGTRILVDSSKVPTRALLLAGIPGIRVHVIHLVRDVRAVVHAWQKEKFNPACGRALPTYSTARTVSYWCARNVLAGLLGSRMPCTRLRYEDFTRSPRQTLREVVNVIEPLRGKELPFLDDDRIELHSLHTIGGNPDRFTSGATRIRADARWMEALPAGSRRLATAIATPLLLRYGYPLRIHPDDPSR